VVSVQRFLGLDPLAVPQLVHVVGIPSASFCAEVGPRKTPLHDLSPLQSPYGITYVSFGYYISFWGIRRLISLASGERLPFQPRDGELTGGGAC
jgi:hypothetical protein